MLAGLTEKAQQQHWLFIEDEFQLSQLAEPRGGQAACFECQWFKLISSFPRAGATSRENQNHLLVLLAYNSERPGKMLKKKVTSGFLLCPYRKATQTICSSWMRDKAGRDVCTASGLFGKPGLHLVCVPSPFYPLILRSFPAAFVYPGSAAPQIQDCSNQSFREKKHRRRKKPTFLSIQPPVRSQGSHILLQRHQVVASLPLNIPSK